MPSKPVFGRHFARQSNQRTLRNYPQADNQTFRITRGRPSGFAKVGTTRGIERKPIFQQLPGFFTTEPCADVDCEAYRDGFAVRINLDPMQDPEDLHLNQARSGFIHYKSGRSFTVIWEGTDEVFRFPPGQTCFKLHYTATERSPILLHVNPRGEIQKQETNQFVDKYNETAHLLNRRRQSG